MSELAWGVCGVCFVLLFMDWKQTTKIALDPIHRSEMNPILGKHPTVRQVNVYFALVLAVTVLGTYLGLRFIPAGTWQGAALGLFAAATAFEGFVVWRNKQRGL